MKPFLIVAAFFCQMTFISAQSKFVLAHETKRLKSQALLRHQNNRMYFPAGTFDGLLVYQLNFIGSIEQPNSTEAIQKIYYEERIGTITDSIFIKQDNQKILKMSQQDKLALMHGFYDLPTHIRNKSMEDLTLGQSFLNYQDFWIEVNGKERKLKSYPEHYYDKDVDAVVDPTGRRIILTTFVSEYLRSTAADSIITIFTLINGDTSLSEQQLVCHECIRPQIVGNYLYYGKKFEYMRGADAYDWKLFRAPLFNIAKSELIGEYIELLMVSPDGKYALGKKLIHGKSTLVIVDIAHKKFQYLLGRDYRNYKVFYSPCFRQFAFDRPEDIIYIEYPKVFPFNAIGTDVKPIRSTHSEDEAFWEKYSHESK